MENAKTAPLTGSDRHTIFVALGKNQTVTSNIWLVPGPFQVCDGNAFDTAIDCDGNVLQSQGAVFQLPCNTNLQGTDTVPLIGCDAGLPTASYEVWARALGTPGGSATVTTCATDPVTNEVVCSTENVLLMRLKGKSTFMNVTNALTSLVGDINGDGHLERIALFSGGLQDWFWQYANNGLRLAQLRFYLL